MKDYYKILNISRSSNPSDIKKAYRQAAFFWHPDKNKHPEAHSKFIELCEAYSILIDAEKRRVYDNLYGKYQHSNPSYKTEYKTDPEYEQYLKWVKEELKKAERRVKKSVDNVLTESFSFIDKYGWVILVIIISIVGILGLILSN